MDRFLYERGKEAARRFLVYIFLDLIRDEAEWIRSEAGNYVKGEVWRLSYRGLQSGFLSLDGADSKFVAGKKADLEYSMAESLANRFLSDHSDRFEKFAEEIGQIAGMYAGQFIRSSDARSKKR